MSSIRNRLMALAASAASGITACSGGGGVTSSAFPQGQPSSSAGATSQTATRTYQLGSTAGVYDLPPLGGFSGSLSLPAANVPANTRLTLTSAFQAPAGAPSLQDAVRREQATGTLNVYFYTTILLSSTVTFPTLPGFSVTLPATVNPAGLPFFYAISNPRPSNGAEVQFRTEGPATVSGSERVLFSFKGPEEAALGPYGGLIAVNGAGTVFAMNTSCTERLRCYFKGGTDGADPSGSLIAVNGALYGTTTLGGAGGNGTVFEAALPQ